MLPSLQELAVLKSFMSRVSRELSNPNPSGNGNADPADSATSRGPSPAHSPERSSSAGEF